MRLASCKLEFWYSQCSFGVDRCKVASLFDDTSTDENTHRSEHDIANDVVDRIADDVDRVHERDSTHRALQRAMTFLNSLLLLTRTARCSVHLLRHSHSPRLQVSLFRTMATASQSALSKLHSPLKELVTGAVQEGSPDFGRTEKDQTDVAGWIDIVAAGNSVKPDTLKASRQTCVLR